MKNSVVTKVIDAQEVRDSLRKLQQEIVSVMNKNGFEGIEGTDEVQVNYGDLDFWSMELRRLISFFI